MFKKIFEQTINPNINKELIILANNIKKVEKEYYNLNIQGKLKDNEFLKDINYVNAKKYMEKIENAFSDLGTYLRALSVMLKSTNFIDADFEVKMKNKSLMKR